MCYNLTFYVNRGILIIALLFVSTTNSKKCALNNLPKKRKETIPMNTTEKIAALFSQYGVLAIQVLGREIDAKEATITIGDEKLSVPIKPVLGFSIEVRELREMLEESNISSRIQTQFHGPGSVILKMLSD